MFVQIPLLDLIFSFYLDLLNKCRFWDNFKIQWAPKRDPKTTKWHQNNQTQFIEQAYFFEKR